MNNLSVTSSLQFKVTLKRPQAKIQKSMLKLVTADFQRLGQTHVEHGRHLKNTKILEAWVD